MDCDEEMQSKESQYLLTMDDHINALRSSPLKPELQSLAGILASRENELCDRLLLRLSHLHEGLMKEMDRFATTAAEINRDLKKDLVARDGLCKAIGESQLVEEMAAYKTRCAELESQKKTALDTVIDLEEKLRTKEHELTMAKEKMEVEAKMKNVKGLFLEQCENLLNRCKDLVKNPKAIDVAEAQLLEEADMCKARCVELEVEQKMDHKMIGRMEKKLKRRQSALKEKDVKLKNTEARLEASELKNHGMEQKLKQLEVGMKGMSKIMEEYELKCWSHFLPQEKVPSLWENWDSSKRKSTESLKKESSPSEKSQIRKFPAWGSNNEWKKPKREPNNEWNRETNNEWKKSNGGPAVATIWGSKMLSDDGWPSS